MSHNHATLFDIAAEALPDREAADYSWAKRVAAALYKPPSPGDSPDSPAA